MNDLAIVTKLMFKEKRDIVLSIVLGFVAGLATVFLFAASGYLISKAALSAPIYALALLIASVKMLSFIRAFSKYGERYFSHRATFTVLSNLRVSFFEKLEPLAPGIFQKYRSGDLLSRIVGDVESLQNYFLRVFYPPIVLVLVFLSTILFTSFFSFFAAILLFVGLILTTFVIPGLFALKQRKIDSHVRTQRGYLSTEVAEFLHGFRDLKIYQKLQGKEQMLEESSDTYINQQETENKAILFSQSVNIFVTLFITWSILAMGAYFIGVGELDGIFLAMLVMISITVFEDASPMAIFPIYFNDTKRAANRLFSVVSDTETEQHKSGLQEGELNEVPNIEMRNVQFLFPGDLRKTLADINLSLPAGSKTAIVGASGSGKSTVMQLLLNIYAVEEGEICFDNIPLTQVKQESIWEKANVVLQSNHFFYGTIRDNLLLANASLVDKELQEVLEKVHLGSFDLEDPVYERGENLSGGEKQRLAIARSLLKNKGLWFLDEPTSSIDAITEKKIYNHIFQQAKHDTLVLISHRLIGMENMDQIIVMDHGQIVECGTYEELMQMKGYFYQMKEIEKNLL
ncbi:thiol reductant ABC exporter subunit CydC [Virgibacillus sp. SK37]|uniref:thiol reductant ABC exporter subunit CydC n=1 Tax=Virgibacillus sp. SK37 TaxID=403957 RepID=UPI0004D0D0D8|nr:thiol reductant ABC exporter subunit CydC [Virgibacillus sp. SK37]AIF42201.1 ABC transporter ATP-binding protein [Virgibacillus sp. SK37]